MARPRYLLSIFFFRSWGSAIKMHLHNLGYAERLRAKQTNNFKLPARAENTRPFEAVCAVCLWMCAYVSARAQRKDITTFNNTTKTPEWADAYKTTNKTCKKTKNWKSEAEAENRSSNNALWPLFFSLCLFCSLYVLAATICSKCNAISAE